MRACREGGSPSGSPIERNTGGSSGGACHVRIRRFLFFVFHSGLDRNAGGVVTTIDCGCSFDAKLEFKVLQLLISKQRSKEAKKQRSTEAKKHTTPHTQ